MPPRSARSLDRLERADRRPRPARRGRADRRRRAAQKALWEVRKAGPQHHDVDERRRQAGVVHRGLRGAARASRRIHRPADARCSASTAPSGTWYAHASVGTLHVRPILDMRRDGAAKMRAIAEEAAAMVREYKGAYSGEHGDGLCRGEWVAWQFGPRLDRAFARDQGAVRPGQPHESRQDRRPAENGRCVAVPLPARLTAAPRSSRSSTGRRGTSSAIRSTGGESAPGTGSDATHGLAKAVEMCNNNGHCRKFDAGTMCPSYRVTRDEQHVTRGRANTLRLALSQWPARGQLEDLATVSRAMRCAMRSTCACRARAASANVRPASTWRSSRSRLSPRAAIARGLALRDRLFAYLPRYAPAASSSAWLANARDSIPGARGAVRARCRHLRQAQPAGVARRLPARGERARPRRRTRRARARKRCSSSTPSPIISRSEIAAEARRVLEAAGYRVHINLRSPARGRSAADGPSLPRGWSTRRRPRRGGRSMRCCPSPGAAWRSSGSSPPACSACATSS